MTLQRMKAISEDLANIGFNLIIFAMPLVLIVLASLLLLKGEIHIVATNVDPLQAWAHQQ